jgi:hypothetical protein
MFPNSLFIKHNYGLFLLFKGQVQESIAVLKEVNSVRKDDDNNKVALNADLSMAEECILKTLSRLKDPLLG